MRADSDRCARATTPWRSPRRWRTRPRRPRRTSTNPHSRSYPPSRAPGTKRAVGGEDARGDPRALPLASGRWMLKRSEHLRRWNKRWVSLDETGESVIIKANPADEKALSSVRLADVRCAPPAPPRHPLLFGRETASSDCSDPTARRSGRSTPIPGRPRPRADPPPSVRSQHRQRLLAQLPRQPVLLPLLRARRDARPGARAGHLPRRHLPDEASVGSRTSARSPRSRTPRPRHPPPRHPPAHPSPLPPPPPPRRRPARSPRPSRGPASPRGVVASLSLRRRRGHARGAPLPRTHSPAHPRPHHRSLAHVRGRLPADVSPSSASAGGSTPRSASASSVRSGASSARSGSGSGRVPRRPVPRLGSSVPTRASRLRSRPWLRSFRGPTTRRARRCSARPR